MEKETRQKNPHAVALVALARGVKKTLSPAERERRRLSGLALAAGNRQRALDRKKRGETSATTALDAQAAA